MNKINKNFKYVTNRGFTLIELLIVISIIGLLSSVVLASLSSAREKATEAKVKAELGQLKIALELYYNEHGSYPKPTNSSAGVPNSDGGHWFCIGGTYCKIFGASINVDLNSTGLAFNFKPDLKDDLSNNFAATFNYKPSLDNVVIKTENGDVSGFSYFVPKEMSNKEYSPAIVFATPKEVSQAEVVSWTFSDISDKTSDDI